MSESTAWGCEWCGNDLATVVLTDGQKVCLDCAEELEPTTSADANRLPLAEAADPALLSPHRIL